MLATSGEERQKGVDAPTLKESDIDLLFTNWRGLVAPPGLSDEDRDALITAIEDMHATPGWKEALEQNGWTDAFITGDEYEQFMVEQDKRVADVLTDLGLA